MRIERSLLDTAVQRGIIDQPQAQALWTLLVEDQKDTPQFSFNHLLYYLGGLVAIGGVSVFVTLGWETLGGPGLALVGLAVMAVAAILTDYFLNQQKLAIPAGLMAALVVAATPLAIYGIQRTLGFWQATDTYRSFHVLVDWRWIGMELGTLIVGAAVYWRWRLPFSIMPVAFVLWYLSMDLAPLVHAALTGNLKPFNPDLPYEQQRVLANLYWDIRRWVSVVFGLIVAGCAIAVDSTNRSGRDHAFWLHLAGVAAFWGGLTAMDSNNEFGKFVYFLINLTMLLFGAAIGRRVYTVFGGFGIAAYLGHLSYKVFRDSLMFPVALMLIGLGVIWLGVLWQRHEAAINAMLQRYLPESLRRLTLQGR